jgi:hypothetical protein
MAEGLFNFLNILVLPVWLSMLLFPRARFTQRLVMSYWPFIVLGAVYTLLLAVALLSSPAGLSLSFDALRTVFVSDWVFVAGWAHYLMLDLFAGVWLFRDAKYWGVNPTLYLLLTLFFAPLGLGVYLLTRQRKTKGDPVRSLN